jgi:uncharacterized phiE125 gp8 family phage protein
MNFQYERTVAPTVNPITLEEAKRQLRYEDTDYDTEIGELVDIATQHMDGPFGVLGRAIVTQTWTIKTDFPSRAGVNGAIPIKLGYLQSVESITYRDSNDEIQTLASSAYAVITGERGCVYPVGGLSWPETANNRLQPVTITVVVGYPSDGTSPASAALVANIPAGIKQALKLHVSHMFEIRDIVLMGGGSVAEVTMSYDSLIAPHRITGNGDE